MGTSADEPIRFLADDGVADQRIDRALAARLDVPRNRLQRWIAAGWVTVNGRVAKAAYRLQPGDDVTATPREPATDTRVEAEPGPLTIVFEDPDLIVLDKPAGLTVHPGAGRPNGTLANRLVAFDPDLAGIGGPGRPGIVHRLDKDTTGIMVVARSDLAYRALSTAFAERTVDKRYLAVVYGVPASAGETREIDLPIARHAIDRTRMTVHPRGRPATTRCLVIGTAGACALVALELLTGRTHQIRIHMKAIGHPLVGDPVYGENRWRGVHPTARRPLTQFSRPALHAHRLGFAHPRTGAALHFEAQPADDLRTLWRDLGGDWPSSR